MSKAERTRQHIIEKVAPVFNRKGYSSTSIRDMAKATGLTKGGIYGNFEGGKGEVAEAAFDYNLMLLRTEGVKRIKSKTNAIDKLRVYPHFYRKIYSKTLKGGGCVILNTVVDCDDGSDPVHKRLYEKARQVLAEWEAVIIHIIEKGKQYEQIHPDTDAAKYASLFIALIEGGIMLAKSRDDTAHLFRALDHIEFLIDTQLKR